MPKIALPNKGRLSDDIRQLLRDAGLDIAGGDDRSLMAPMAEGFFAIFVRAQDIPTFVADGAADAGITGLDCVEESGRVLERRADLGLGACRLALAAPLDRNIRAVSDLPDEARIATSFPNLTRRYFEAAGKRIRVLDVSGAAEVTPKLGLSDAIVDLVATGSTLRSNGLFEVTTLLTSTAQLVSRPPALLDPAVDRAIADLSLSLESVLRARKKRYLMANVPRRALAEVEAILPGLNGPSVLEVAGSEFVAVHAVVDSADVYQTTVRLRALGSQGILVTRIERLMS